MTSPPFLSHSPSLYVDQVGLLDQFYTTRALQKVEEDGCDQDNPSETLIRYLSFEYFLLVPIKSEMNQ